MFSSNDAKFHPRAIYTNLKRALQSRSLPKNAAVGIVLGVIGVIACVLTALLLWHLNRKSRILRCRRRQVDPPGSRVNDPRDTSTLVGNTERMLHIRWRDKSPPGPTNVTDSDTVSNEVSLSEDDDILPNPPIRGRDTPFSQTSTRPDRYLSIVTTASRDKGKAVLSPVAPSDFLDLTSTPTVQDPISTSSRVPMPPMQSQGVRSPLTLTASYTLPGVETPGAVRLDGSRGKGRRITMSVIVDDPDSPTSTGGAEVPPHSFHDYRRDTGIEGGENILGEVLEHYTGS